MPESPGSQGSGTIDIGTAYMAPIYGNAENPTFLLEPQVVIGLNSKLNMDINLVMFNIGTGRFSDSYLGSVGFHGLIRRRGNFKCSIGGGLMLGATYSRNNNGEGDENEYDYTGNGEWNFAGGAFFQLDYGYRFNKYAGIYFGNNINIIYVEFFAAIYGVHSIGFQINWSRSFYSSAEVGIVWNMFGETSGYPFSFGPAITILGYRW